MISILLKPIDAFPTIPAFTVIVNRSVSAIVQDGIPTRKFGFEHVGSVWERTFPFIFILWQERLFSAIVPSTAQTFLFDALTFTVVLKILPVVFVMPVGDT